MASISATLLFSAKAWASAITAVTYSLPVIEEIGGWDAGYRHYVEDIDGRRLAAATIAGVRLIDNVER